MNNQDKIIEIFKKMPGIGPRQAKRMVYYLLSAPKDTLKKLAELVGTIQDDILTCQMCFRYFSKSQIKNGDDSICSICRNPNRKKDTMMIVARDADYESIEKSGVFDGVYFVLGGTIPFSSKNAEETVRIKELLNILNIRLKEGLSEIIFALNATPEGEHTTNIVELRLKEKIQKPIRFSKLGRGFSTGTEVEYSDKETLKNAISSRS
jgi:recombination protein RecR